MQGDAMEILDSCFFDKDLDRIQVFFPDPWHKKRHHKRRMIQPDFVTTLASKMRQGAVLHLATDWENYAEQMLEVMSASTEFSNLAGEGSYSGSGERAETKFERRGRRLGHGIWDLLFEKRE
jgi:tRNA (guanine-N7-)-methyltransferase